MGKKYTVKAGDNLRKIAKELLGDANKWEELYAANKALIKDPNVIQPGMELDIPEDKPQGASPLPASAEELDTPDDKAGARLLGKVK